MKIGILGGTFDPLHFGHIRPAIEVKQQLELDEIWLMPNHIPPHKNTTHVSTVDRLAMAQAACEQYPELKLCTIEAKRDTPSYTVTTLTTLKQQYPQHEFYFLMGMDSFLSLQSWHQWQRLFTLCHLVVCQRPGWQLSADHPMQAIITAQEANTVVNATSKSGNIFQVPITEQPFSSTQIRANLAQQLPTDAALPASVQQYIAQHQLYSSKA
ncbi:nicotinate-nucleotide adenylyltransferase [Shewanella youngdeokensis]|uniref:Probable nicotinate-nucleotide adenylyltransferase n=1 Tax=Shewanella youngdeokensis TaxID=2999068 RepID=A0ABZ0K332_9GAMM|nr:nicotinate-nucleotide adenylyltransferase [Shewanella sp. DAU334]